MRRDKRIDFVGHDQFIVESDTTIPLELPKRIKVTDSGQFIKVDLNGIQLSTDGGNITIRLNEKSQYLSRATAKIFHYVMLHALNGRRKTSTVKRWMDEFNAFTKSIHEHVNGSISTITLGMFNWYTAQKGASQQKLLRSILKYWVVQNVPGIESALQNYLTTSKAPKPRSTIEIQNTDEQERPFSIAQVRAILSKIDSLYISAAFNPQDHLLWRLIVSEAMRPSQIQLLQVGDVTVRSDGSDKQTYTYLQVPIVKQKATPARRYMMEYRLSATVSQALSDHLEFLASLLGHSPPATQPLFCVIRPHGKYFDAQNTAINITHQIYRTRKLISEEDLHLIDDDLFTRRFKHTKLTHLAMLGAPLEVIARAGFQTSTVSLRHYVNLTEEAFAEYEDLLSKNHDDIFNAFKGKVIDRKNPTKPDRHHVILTPEMDDDVGSCSGNPCNVFAPVGCYVCPRFEAFQDGPHQLVLQFLLTKKEQRISMSLSADSIARDDHLISAVQRVIAATESWGDCHAQ